MRNRFFTLALAGFLAGGLVCGAFAQDASDSAQPQAQTRTHRTPNPEHQLRHLTRILNLTANQQSQIKPILEDQDQKLEQLSSNQSLSRKDQRSQRKSITDEANEKINAVLNDQQKQQFAQMQQQKHQKRKAGQ